MTRRQLPKKQPRYEVMSIDPELAKEWLSKNTHNRRLSPAVVESYAEAMANGEWKLNGEPFIFDWNDRLQSGQHRLAAIIEADTAIDSLVVFDADPDNLTSLDSGRRRTLKDALQLQGEKDVSALSSVITWTWRWENDLMDVPSRSATTSHYLKWYAEHPEVKECIPMGARCTRSLGWAKGLMAALYWGLARVDQEDADAWFELVIEQIGLEDKSPARAFVRWSTRQRMLTNRKPSNAAVAANFVKAWNAFREHRPLSQVHHKGSDAFPEAI